MAKMAAKAFAITPDRLRSLLSKMKRLRLVRIPARVKQLVKERIECRVYRLTINDIQSFPHELGSNENCLSDLSRFEQTEPWRSRQVFLRDCLDRLGKGQQVYTQVSDGKLVHYGWLTRGRRKEFFTEVKSEFEYPEGSAVLYDFYTHPDARGRGLYQKNIKHMLNEIRSLPRIQYIYISVLADNGPSRHVIEKLGFEYHCSLFYSRCLTKEYKKKVAASDSN